VKSEYQYLYFKSPAAAGILNLLINSFLTTNNLRQNVYYSTRQPNYPSTADDLADEKHNPCMIHTRDAIIDTIVPLAGRGEIPDQVRDDVRGHTELGYGQWQY
jgi:hypothetical protein